MKPTCQVFYNIVRLKKIDIKIIFVLYFYNNNIFIVSDKFYIYYLICIS